jgi:hypothetical protein
VRANSPIARLPEIAVHAEDLEPWRIAISLQPLVELSAIDGLSMPRAVIVHVVDGKERDTWRFGASVGLRQTPDWTSGEEAS